MQKKKPRMIAGVLAVQRFAHLQVRSGTRDLLMDVRRSILEHGIRKLPTEIATVLESEWTVDTLVRAGLLALIHLLGPNQTGDKRSR